MAKTGINQVTTAQTFQTWLDRTNEIVNIIGTDAMTASSLGDTTTGNATLVGDFTANTVIAEDLFRADNISPRSGSTSIAVSAPVNITTALQNVHTHTSTAGPRILLSSGSVIWTTGFNNTTDNNYILNTGSGTTKFSLTPAGNLTTAGSITAGTGGFIGNVTGDVSGQAGTVAAFTGRNTDDLSEGSANLYFTNARARGAISAGTGVTISAGGQISIGQAVATSSLPTFAQINAAGYDSISVPSAGTSWFNQMNLDSFSDTATLGGTTLGANVGRISVDGKKFAHFILGYNPTTTDPSLPFNSTPSLQQTDLFGILNVVDSGSSIPSYATVLVTSADATQGNIIATGNITAFGTTSDIRRKENIERITGAIEKVSQINGYTYNFIGDERRITGVIAQELEKVLPEAVYETQDPKTQEEIKAVRYGNMVGLLIEAIKDLKMELDNLKNAN